MNILRRILKLQRQSERESHLISQGFNPFYVPVRPKAYAPFAYKLRKAILRRRRR